MNMSQKRNRSKKRYDLNRLNRFIFFFFKIPSPFKIRPPVEKLARLNNELHVVVSRGSYVLTEAIISRTTRLPHHLFPFPSLKDRKTASCRFTSFTQTTLSILMPNHNSSITLVRRLFRKTSSATWGYITTRLKDVYFSKDYKPIVLSPNCWRQICLTLATTSQSYCLVLKPSFRSHPIV